MLAHGVDDVLRQEPAFLSVGEQRAERAPGNAHHHRGAAVSAQPFLEAANQGHRQLREPQRPEHWDDVQGGVLPVGRQRRPFEPGGRAALEP